MSGRPPSGERRGSSEPPGERRGSGEPPGERRVEVAPLPAWIDLHRLLLGLPCELEALEGSAVRATLTLPIADAADLAARLRGVGLAGARVELRVEPPLPRAAVRAARTAEARRMRDGSVGFSRAGVRLDAEGRRSLTPEALALALGRRAGGCRVVDACCGAGGNAIGFARAGCQVVAIELDAERLSMARHNAGIYGVAGRIDFRLGDARELLPELEADLLFIDPPWGGEYDKDGVSLADLPLLQALWPQHARFARTWIKVPPPFDPGELPGTSPRAVFGAAPGDHHRVKFLVLEAGER